MFPLYIPYSQTQVFFQGFVHSLLPGCFGHTQPATPQPTYKGTRVHVRACARCIPHANCITPPHHPHCIILQAQESLLAAYSQILAICDPPPFVFVSVVILLSSISKLTPSKKGIHLTLTNPKTSKTPKQTPIQ